MTKYLFASLLLAWCAVTNAASFHFTNGHIISMRTPQAVPGELIVVDGMITAVGQDLKPPKNAITIDMRGGFLMPGLAEMHAHVPHPSAGTVYRDDVLFLWVSAGITTARGMLGHPDHLLLRQDLLEQRVLGPRLFTSGPSFNGRTVTSPERAIEMVIEQVDAGYDFLKIHPGITTEGYEALAQKAKELGISFAGHVPNEVGLDRAMAQGQLTIDHIDGYVQALIPDLKASDPGYDSFFGVSLIDRVQQDQLAALVQKTVANNVWIVPTETLFENFADANQIPQLLARPEISYLPPALRQRYVRSLTDAQASTDIMNRYVAFRKALLKDMHKAGVKLLLGSDSPQIFNVPGFAIQRELAAMVSAGLTPFEALKTGTVNAAEFLALDTQSGYLEAGSTADLLLLADNPLSNIENVSRVSGVMVRGRWISEQEREQKLAEIATRNSLANPLSN